MKSFETNQGPKQEIREFLAQQVRHLKTPHVLTLPGREGLCVQTLRKANPRTIFRCVERNAADATKVEEAQGVLVERATLFESLSAVRIPTTHLDLAFFDYLGTMSYSTINDLRALLSNRCLVHGGKHLTLAITLLKSARSWGDEQRDLFGHAVDDLDGDSEALYQDHLLRNQVILTSIFNQHGAGGMLVRKEIYQATPESTPMLFYCWRLRID